MLSGTPCLVVGTSALLNAGIAQQVKIQTCIAWIQLFINSHNVSITALRKYKVHNPGFDLHIAQTPEEPQ